MWQIRKPQHWQTQRWKNGGGVTHELARHDDAQGMVWRLSIADVASDGPFSVFPGVDRIIMMLSGGGFRLRFADGATQTLSTVAEPYAFSGDRECDCRLLDGPVQDFNIMTRHDAARAQAQVLTLGGAPQWLPSLGWRRYLFVLEGAVHMSGAGQAETLSRHEMLEWDAAIGPVTVAAAAPGAMALCIAIMPLPGSAR